MEAEKISFLFMAGVLCLLSSGFSNEIDISQPYARGKLVLTEQNLQDTIQFSNGITLVLFSFQHQGPSWNEWFTASSFIFGDSTAQTAGFKYDSLNEINTCSWMSMGEFYFNYIYASQDTVWTDLEFYPDSLSPIDTFSLIPPDGPNYTGKVFMEDYNLNDGNTLDPFHGYNTIVYVRSHDRRKIAFQFNDLEIAGTSPAQELQSITLNWAADSAGNGIFKVPTVISQNKKPAKNYKVITDTWHENTAVTLFDIRGRTLSRSYYSNPGDIRFYRKSSGMYLLRINALNKDNDLKIVTIK